MAQIRRPPHYRSPPAQQIPSLSNPIRFQPPTLVRRTIPPLPSQNNRQFDPVSGLMVASNSFKQSLLTLSSSSNQPTTSVRQQAVVTNNNFRKKFSNLDRRINHFFIIKR